MIAPALAPDNDALPTEFERWAAAAQAAYAARRADWRPRVQHWLDTRRLPPSSPVTPRHVDPLLAALGEAGP